MSSYKRKKTYKKKTYKKRHLKKKTYKKRHFKKKTYKKKTLIKKTFKGGSPMNKLLNALNKLDLEGVKASFIEEGNGLMDNVIEGSDKKPLIKYFLENIRESLTEDNIHKWKDIAIFLYFNGYDENIIKNDIIKYALERLDLESLKLLISKKTDLTDDNKVIFKNIFRTLKDSSDIDKWINIQSYLKNI